MPALLQTLCSRKNFVLAKISKIVMKRPLALKMDESTLNIKNVFFPHTFLKELLSIPFFQVFIYQKTLISSPKALAFLIFQVWEWLL